MPPDRSFRRNFLVIATLHVLFVVGVWVVGSLQGKPVASQVIWLDGGSIGGGETPGETSAAAAPAPPPEPEPIPNLIPEPPQPVPTPAAPSEIVTVKATPAPTTPKPNTPKPETPKPETPKPETPKPKPTTPKATPKATPKPKPKPTTPKATPREVGDSTPKPKSSPSEKPKDAPDTSKSEGATTTDSQAATTGGNGPGSGNGKGPGKTGRGSGTSEFGWYFSMLHDRFHNRWEQPTSIVRASQDFVTTLKIRIANDGTILSHELVRSSGDTVMDESVMAAASRVKQIDPLPAGLGNGDLFEVNVAFKLDQGL